MLPSKGLMRVLALIGYALGIFGAIWTSGAWAGSKIVWKSEFTVAIDKITRSVDCNGYHQRMNNIETRETIQTNARSQIDAMRQASVRLTPAEIQRYNDIILDLDRLKDARQKLIAPEGCQ